jgi:flagellar motility protein MotE (MotC chaperone)
MVTARIMKLWIGLGVALLVSVMVPVYGTGSEQVTSTPDSGVKVSPQMTTSEHSTDSTGGSSEKKNSNATSPELTLAEKLQARLQQIEQREERIQDDEQRLAALRQDLEALATRQEKAIAEAMAFRESQKSTEETDQSQESLKHLIKVYEAMDPEEAALRISQMNEPLALDILAGIKDKKAAGMLAGIEPGKAAKLTQGLRNYHERKRAPTTP